MSKYKPQLWHNTDVPPEEMEYPLLASYKYDGVRFVIQDGEIKSRSLKPIPNVHIPDYFLDILRWSRLYPDTVIDAEFYHPDKTHGEIVSACRSHDEPDLKGFVLVIFDMVNTLCRTIPFQQRSYEARQVASRTEHCESPQTFMCREPYDVSMLYDKAIDEGYEGLVLNNPEAYYKYGRITAKSGDGYKMKPLQTWDSKIVGIEQATVVDPDAPKKINELGRSETSRKKDDRIPIPMARNFVVAWAGKEIPIPISMTDEEKEEIWVNQDKYIGQWVEWAGMPYGMKDTPRFPRTVRMRWDKD